MLYVGLDVGTTGAKAIAFTPDGQPVGSGFEEYGVCFPGPSMAEQDAEAVFQTALRVLAHAAQQSGGDIGAIGLSVQGDAVLALDEAMRPLSPVHLGMDYRCQSQAAAFERDFGAQALFEKTGMRPHPMNSLCKIRYMMEEMPTVAAQARHFMTYADYILYRLGSDVPVIDLTMATRTMGMRLGDLKWDESLLQAAGIDSGMLSRPTPSATVVGTLSPGLADSLHIARGAKLVTGGHDQTCAALGAGIVCANRALDSHGTAEVISAAFDGVNTSPAMFEGFYPCYAHTVPGMYFTFSLNHTGGILLKWFVENFCEADVQRAALAGESVYSHVLRQSESGRIGDLMVLPYFNGKGTPGADLNARGMFFGLTLGTSRYDIARAVVESLCFDLRENREALQKAGISIDDMRCVGGGARSEQGLQMKADVAGIPMHTLKIREAACFGAALLAGLACGEYRNAQEAASLVHLDRTYEPNPHTAAHYEEKYRRYLALYRANRFLWAAPESCGAGEKPGER